MPRGPGEWGSQKMGCVEGELAIILIGLESRSSERWESGDMAEKALN